MGRLAKRNLWKISASHRPPQLAYTQINLTRGLAQHLPFPNAAFDSVVATFPAEYIFDPTTITEVQRVLAPGGRFVILPGATITSRGSVDRVLAWIFRITGEAPANLSEIIHQRSKESLANAGFQVQTHEVDIKLSLVFIIVATKIQIAEEVAHV
jgi:ubiquinone/menaquinone biosynthesis C-methylase UbiE